ncbi:hypothetical protein [Streptomyces spectabilis]|uniref:Uncharacterized protein n=1 Tax=Streptomyces spectabilis TaxID=68270 RepID=A0A5P2XJC9_STRST|nr:hypothetical protein [Streptomyces spectabilis]MBB5105617.1 hypothetical protein [Streptomyces spectabilis]MCI3906799.1 hypothetical protein [Streptomyces spectabilis]QEV65147.1 hypothetical protein CP982_36925 [Streptomyces spectabilis]GGV22803.1 hypothetical protein GCM10010245_38230 [Streptomyces spectabilis]
MDTALTISVILTLFMGVAYVIQHLNAQRAGQMAPLSHGRFLPGGRGARGSAVRPVPGLPGPPAVPERRDHRVGGRGRLRPRRRIQRARGRR